LLKKEKLLQDDLELYDGAVTDNSEFNQDEDLFDIEDGESGLMSQYTQQLVKLSEKGLDEEILNADLELNDSTAAESVDSSKDEDLFDIEEGESGFMSQYTQQLVKLSDKALDKKELLHDYAALKDNTVSESIEHPEEEELFADDANELDSDELLFDDAEIDGHAVSEDIEHSDDDELFTSDADESDLLNEDTAELVTETSDVDLSDAQIYAPDLLNYKPKSTQMNNKKY